MSACRYCGNSRAVLAGFGTLCEDVAACNKRVARAARKIGLSPPPSRPVVSTSLINPRWGVAVCLPDGVRVVVSTHDSALAAQTALDRYVASYIARPQTMPTFATVERFNGFLVGDSWDAS